MNLRGLVVMDDFADIEDSSLDDLLLTMNRSTPDVWIDSWSSKTLKTWKYGPNNWKPF